MTVAIVTDSTAYISEELRKELGIHMVPLTVAFGNETYREEIDISADEFYHKVKEDGELPKTSQPSIGLVTEMLNELAKDHKEVIFVTLSSGISGTYQTVTTANTMTDGIEAIPFDSEISCYAQGFYAIEAAKLAKQGKNSEQILLRLNEIKQAMRAYFVVDDLTHLQRGGRLNGAQAFIGSMLQVKPILHFVDKKIVPFEKIRTKKKALKRVFELFAEDAVTGVPIRAVVIHANRLEEAQTIKEELEKQYSNITVDISYFGPVIGTHLGEGAIGLGWYKE
ncbi:DegV family protein with EDD domain [Gracilibacillus halotolerans]|uniref:DegV family protein with EDD domain n=1 Tax=Gracilibacillus halotolerans TaxID=74386 RepID=A0A841RLE1_9BACI|nr:DegV family protein [Gracilibacillus halotolerans]MBB6512276.1 DegV family protein with EDD domain [Gracilibacillus halotolerans]